MTAAFHRDNVIVLADERRKRLRVVPNSEWSPLAEWLGRGMFPPATRNDYPMLPCDTEWDEPA